MEETISLSGIQDKIRNDNKAVTVNYLGKDPMFRGKAIKFFKVMYLDKFKAAPTLLGKLADDTGFFISSDPKEQFGVIQ